MLNVKSNLKSLVSFVRRSFYQASNWWEEIEEIFGEAAGGESSGGVNFHGWAPIGLPGAKFHAMTGQMEKSHDVRRSRASGRAYSAKAMGRPDYYGSFEKTNNFKM